MTNRLFVLGAMKAGTTTAHSVFQSFPGIATPRAKEPDYFLRASWRVAPVLRHSVLCSPRNPILYVDCSPNYSRAGILQLAIDRIRSTFESAKFAFIYREPLARMQSHVNHVRLAGGAIPNILEPTSPFVSQSLYFKQLKPFLGLIEDGGLMVLDFDDLIADPVETCLQLTRQCLGPVPSLREEIRRLHINPPHQNNSSQRQIRHPVVDRLLRSSSLRQIADSLDGRAKSVIMQATHRGRLPTSPSSGSGPSRKASQVLAADWARFVDEIAPHRLRITEVRDQVQDAQEEPDAV